MSELVRYEKQGGIGILTLSRPEKLNALTPEMAETIPEFMQQMNEDEDLRCVIVRGEGRAFSAGGDLAFLEANTQRSEEDNTVDMRDFYSRFLAIAAVDVPTIALLHGPVTGAGLCFALGCDLRYAAEDAVLSVNFTKLGITPGMGGTWLLPRLIGPARAAELFYTGRGVRSQEALALGLVNGVCAAEALEATGRQVAEAIAANAPEAVRATKQLLLENNDWALAETLSREAAAQARGFAGREVLEGLAAIREKRAARY